MNYLFLAYHDNPPGEELVRAALANNAALRESGYLLAEVAMPGETAVTVSHKNGSVVLTDGSAAGPQPLSTLFFIEARDLNEAIQLAARMPQLLSGPIEIRPFTVLIK